MEVKEGSCLSVLGLINLNLETGNVQMTNLMAVIAGGIQEAKKYLKTELNATRT